MCVQLAGSGHHDWLVDTGGGTGATPERLDLIGQGVLARGWVGDEQAGQPQLQYSTLG